MTKLLYVPTGQIISLFTNHEGNWNGQRTLEIEKSIYRTVYRALDSLDVLYTQNDLLIARENNIKIPILDGEIEILYD